MDDLRARICFQWDIRDCNILCLTETWLTPSVPDNAVIPYDNFSVLRMDRTAEAGKTKGGGVCFMINKKWCDLKNISIPSRSCSPHLEHLSIMCRARFHRSSLLLFTSHHRQTLALTMLKLQTSEQTPLMWKPGETLFNKRKSPPFTMDLT